MVFFRPLGPRCLLPDLQSRVAMGQVVLTRCSEWLRAARHPKTLFEQKPALSPLRPSRCFSELVSSLRAGEAQEGERESECAGGVKGGEEKKPRRHTATERGPRKIFNPNNEHCRFLPQSAFPVNFPGQAGGAKNGRALCLVSVCARKGMCPGDTVP